MKRTEKKPRNLLTLSQKLNYEIENMKCEFYFPDEYIPREIKKFDNYKNWYIHSGLPYIGWYWRGVDFDSVGGKLLGIQRDLYAKRMGIDFKIVSFDESGKFDADKIYIGRRQWAELKERVITFVERKDQRSFDSVIHLMQSFLKTSKVMEYGSKEISKLSRKIKEYDKKTAGPKEKTGAKRAVKSGKIKI